MNEEAAKSLREAFPAEIIGKLPRIVCKACSDSRTKVCSEHKKSKCAECDNYITERHIHLDYVGHAAVTDRLLQVDPEWAWEPVAFGDDGAPLIKRDGSEARMWIRLTIAGTTRFGVGIAPGNAFELEKQLISDAIRNAAMRFGVALDLWSKEDLHSSETGEIEERAGDRTTPPQAGSAGPSQPPPGGAGAAATKPQRAKIQHLVNQTGAVPTPWPLPDDLSKSQASEIIDWLGTFPIEPPAERVETLRKDAAAAADEFAGTP